jgi:hypothetical protein
MLWHDRGPHAVLSRHDELDVAAGLGHSWKPAASSRRFLLEGSGPSGNDLDLDRVEPRCKVACGGRK